MFAPDTAVAREAGDATLRSMQNWPVAETHKLAQVIAEIGDCFIVRRTLQRLEFAEITIQEAIDRLAGDRERETYFTGTLADVLEQYGKL